MKRKKINIAFGNNCRRHRENNGYNQYDFAFECGISETYYGRIERGEHSVTIELAQKIARNLGITISELTIGIER